MTAREYLSQVYKLENKLHIMELEAKEYRRLAASVPGQDFTKERVQGGPISKDAPFVKWIIKAHEKETEIKRKMEELISLKAKILATIDLVDNDYYRAILKLRYIESHPFPDIAEKLFLAESTIKRMHREALKYFDENIIPKIDTK